MSCIGPIMSTVNLGFRRTMSGHSVRRDAMTNRVLKEYEETLSLRDLARRAVAPKADAEAACLSRAVRPRVFVIDDEEGICQFIAAALDSLGYEADYFTNAQLALRALKHCSPA